MGTSNDDGATGAILSIDSSYYLISNTGSLDHDCTDTAWHPGVPTGSDLYILKLNDTGKVLWDSSYGGTQTDGANTAFFDTRDSTIVICGFTYSDDYMVTGYQGGGDMWVVKVNKNGTLIWEKTLGSPNQENGTGICDAYNGGYIAYGSTFPGPIGGVDCWLFSLDDSGNEISNKIFGGSQDDEPYSIINCFGGYAAVGWSISNTFTEGSNYGNFAGGGESFISYINLEELAVNNIKNNTQQLLIYPNPSQKLATVILPNNEGNLIISNSVGELIFNKKINQPSKCLEINTGQWADGLYLVQWMNEDGTILTTKFIKN